MLVKPGHDSCLTVAAELNVHLLIEHKVLKFAILQLNLYLFQSLPEHEFASADILVGKKVANLAEVELGGEVAGHRGDDVPHREAGKELSVQISSTPQVLKVVKMKSHLPEWNWSKMACQ